MPIGNHVNILNLNLGGIDLLNPKEAQYTEVNFYNTIFDPFPKLVVGVLDFKNSVLPNLKNDQVTSINIGIENGGEPLNYNFKPYEEVNVNDRSMSKQTAMKSKMFDYKLIDEGYLNMKAHSHMSKSHETQVSKMVEDWVKNVLKSNASFEAEETKGNQRFISRGDPQKVFSHYLSRSVSNSNKGSAYVLYRPDYNKYKYETIEKMITQGPVATYQQRTTLAGASEQERLFSIQHIKVYGSNNNEYSYLKGTQQRSYDPSTGKATWPNTTSNQFKTAGSPQDPSLPSWIQNTNFYNRNFERTQHSRDNTKSPTDVMRARSDRAAYLDTLTKNYAEIAVPLNTILKPGSMINLEIPAKTSDPSGNEKFSGPSLIVNVRHKILPAGRGVSYVRVTKGGGQQA